MGKKAGIVGDTDGNLSQIVLTTNDSTELYLGSGRLIGYYIEVALSAHALPVKDDDTVLFTIPASLAVTGNFIPIGGQDGLEFLTSLVIDPDNAATGGKVMFVWQPYQDS